MLPQEKVTNSEGCEYFIKKSLKRKLKKDPAVLSVRYSQFECVILARLEEYIEIESLKNFTGKSRDIIDSTLFHYHIAPRIRNREVKQ